MIKWNNIVLVFLLVSCQSSYRCYQIEHRVVSVDHSHQQSAINELIAPYRNSLDSLMNEVIGYTEMDLVRESPEGSLGNFVCDELLAYVKKNTDRPVHFCMLNNGGLRIPSIAAGEVHTGVLYELLPFENTLEVIEMDGFSCKKLLDGAAVQGGVPVAGIRFKIINEEATDIVIDGAPFDVQKRYFILTNDYMANGGEKLMKQAIHRYSLNVKLRDSMIEQLREKKANGQTIKTIKDGRIVKI